MCVNVCQCVSCPGSAVISGLEVAGLLSLLLVVAGAVLAIYWMWGRQRHAALTVFSYQTQHTGQTELKPIITNTGSGNIRLPAQGKYWPDVGSLSSSLLELTKYIFPLFGKVSKYYYYGYFYTIFNSGLILESRKNTKESIPSWEFYMLLIFIFTLTDSLNKIFWLGQECKPTRQRPRIWG